MAKLATLMGDLNAAEYAGEFSNLLLHKGTFGIFSFIVTKKQELPIMKVSLLSQRNCVSIVVIV